MRIGQVSLPVLSRKGKADHWTYNWYSSKNYTVNFNEDFFVKIFFLSFVMHSLTVNKCFAYIFYKNIGLNGVIGKNQTQPMLAEQPQDIFVKLRQRARPKYYVSKIYLCRSKGWLYIYTFLYKLRSLKALHRRRKRCVTYINHDYLYQVYNFSKNKHTKVIKYTRPEQIIFLINSYR